MFSNEVKVAAAFTLKIISQKMMKMEKNHLLYQAN